MTPISQATTDSKLNIAPCAGRYRAIKSRHTRDGFTLIEIMVVVVILGLMAAMIAPRISIYYEPPMTALRRNIDELSNLALSGVSVRIRQDGDPFSKLRGAVTVEAFAKVSDDKQPSRTELAWVPWKPTYPMTGEGWLLEPKIIYFYSDGSCTPARISYGADNASPSEQDKAILTVTGYLKIL